MSDRGKTMLLMNNIMRARWTTLLLLALIGSGFTPGHAQSVLPPVSYQPAQRTVFVGTAGTTAPTPITLAQVAAALQAQGHPDLLVQQSSGVWLLSAHLVVSSTAQLDVRAPEVSWLRLSSSTLPAPFAATLTAVDGGAIRIEGAQVSSWDPARNAYDNEPADGRSYLLALRGARLDLINAEAAYLGSGPGEPSGISWRKRRRDNDPTSGATGQVVGSRIHHNYFGLYSYQAYGLRILRNEVFANLYYGIDPHDDSINLEIAENQVHHNGKHGIILSRGCANSVIRDNVVFDNAAHGIMLDRGSNNNQVYGNRVERNDDGIVIFQSSNNIVRNNRVTGNTVGMRLNASVMPGDSFDAVTTGNHLLNNEIRNNREYGIYLYQRADRNRLEANTISGHALSGIYLKTGGNRITGNTLEANGHGITMLGEPLSLPPGAQPALEQPGANNVIVGNAIRANGGVGIRLLGATNTRIGQEREAGSPADGNTIIDNAADGIAISEYTAAGSIQAATGSQIIGNTIQHNGRHGVLIRDASSVGHRISRNAISANGGRGISIGDGANRGVQPPLILAFDARTGDLSGTAAPGATVEVYRDAGGEGLLYQGSVTSGADGRWSLRLPAGGDPSLAPTALTVLNSGDTSAFSGSSGGVARYQVGTDDRGQTTIRVSGAGATLTLPELRANLGANQALVQDLGNGVWQLNANLVIEREVTLNLTASSGVRELRLRSQPTPIDGPSCSGELCRYRTFVYLRTNSGTINIEGVRVISWDPAASVPDTDLTNGRSYVLAKYDATLNIRNAELAYLGFGEGESYGVAWRDINDPAQPNVVRARVTGEVSDSRFHHNYYGVYTFQASGMLFRGNAFFANLRYGFDPHDFSTDFVVENNQAYENGSHGFILSRGCVNFVLRNNSSFRNTDPGPSLAHGFMLDPGSPDSSDPQAPSRNNLLEGNQAYENEGYGLRLLGAPDNIVRNNDFHHNRAGIVVEAGSTANRIENNRLAANQSDGLFVRGGADGTLVSGNQLRDNGRHGLYLKANAAQVERNLIHANRGNGVTLLPESGVDGALADLTMPDAAVSLAASDPTLIGPAQQEAALEDNVLVENEITNNTGAGLDLRGALNGVVRANTITANGNHGLYLTDGTQASRIERNTIANNGGQGLRANGTATQSNTWSENSIFANRGGIAVTGGAQAGVTAPRITVTRPTVVAGTADPGATVEIFSDDGGQGRYFEGRTVASATGVWSFQPGRVWRGRTLNATATAANGTSSRFAIESASVSEPATVYLPLVTR
ncbi:right-handed parallel beta-helix repeat-containing protein [Kallotenue papyrolyticum]|uniref:right-handed parallel beta-helix repeat-containing protein n=1 Tax=Kallotenue papyrolyticum TaxID=1325125 RepID=UPI0004BCBF46|nr:right-handed parallel beta-helix repeat-containing protein [Kallotenue papyrolyticum]